MLQEKKSDETNEIYVFDNNCQETQSINIQPVKPEMDMQLPKPALLYKSITRSEIHMTRTVNLQGNIPRNVNIPRVCAIARTVNLQI